MSKSLHSRLQALEGEKDQLKKAITFLAILTEALKSVAVKPVLVGGRALEFYTLGGYATRDIDLVLNGRVQTASVLENMGFKKHIGERHWYHEILDIAVEIPDDTLAGSIERITTVEIDGMECYIIGIEDLIIDRLAAAKFWQSPGDAQWAAKLLALHVNDIDAGYLHAAAKKAGVDEMLEQVWKQSRTYLQQNSEI